MATAVRRQHDRRKVVSDLLAAGINEKKARSVKCQITVAKLPFARENEAFTFDGTPINETLMLVLAWDAERARDAVPGLTVANWVETRL